MEHSKSLEKFVMSTSSRMITELCKLKDRHQTKVMEESVCVVSVKIHKCTICCGNQLFHIRYFKSASSIARSYYTYCIYSGFCVCLQSNNGRKLCCYATKFEGMLSEFSYFSGDGVQFFKVLLCFVFHCLLNVQVHAVLVPFILKIFILSHHVINNQSFCIFCNDPNET